MRNWGGWAAAALVAAGCGGAGGETALGQGTKDEHEGPDVTCAECRVTGGGQLEVQGQTVQFAIGPQNVRFMVVPASGDGFTLRGDVEATVDCAREGGVLTATVTGTLEGGEAFALAVVDGGEPEQDALTFTADGVSFTADVADGNVQVHDLDRCEPACPEGECVCPDTGACEPCEEPPPPPPECAYGTCWCEETQACGPCEEPPPPPQCGYGLCWCAESMACEPCDGEGQPHEHPPVGGPPVTGPGGGGGGGDDPPPGPFIPL